MTIRTKLVGTIAAGAAVAVGVYAIAAASEEPRHGPGAMHGMGRMGHGMNAGMRPGATGRGMMGHGASQATREQVRDIHELLANHDSIKRTVTNLAEGIRTVTESDDPQIAQIIKTHVTDMMRRVQAGDNGDLPMQTSRLHAIFRNKDKIRTTTETTDKGVIVVQSSNDPDTIAALQAHAADVTGLVRGGMAAMHASMMNETGGPMRGETRHGPMTGHGMMHGAR